MAIEKQRRRPHVLAMQRPIDVDLPHKLGREEARRRIAGNFHKLRDHIPGGAAQVDSSWTGDQLNLDIVAMGQKVAALIDRSPLCGLPQLFWQPTVVLTAPDPGVTFFMTQVFHRDTSQRV